MNFQIQYYATRFWKRSSVYGNYNVISIRNHHMCECENVIRGILALSSFSSFRLEDYDAFSQIQWFFSPNSSKNTLYIEMMVI